MISSQHSTTPAALMPSARARTAMVKKLSGMTASLTTAAVSEMEARHDWFRELDARHRSWITLVARAGIDGFVDWFADRAEDGSTAAVFNSAPRELLREMSLHQTVELVRTTIDVIESELQQRLPRSERSVMQLAIVHYSREIAFAAAEVYAQAAETRGAWDARMESQVVDAVVRGEAGPEVMSRASTLGWTSTEAVCVVIGHAPEEGINTEALRRITNQRQAELLGSVQGERVVLLLAGPPVLDSEGALTLSTHLIQAFGPGPVVVGPTVANLEEAVSSARSALSGLRAAHAWTHSPRPVLADALLPERALAGDGHARRRLGVEIFGDLHNSGGDLELTLVAFLDAGGSVEATARSLFVHANTVRYRLRRIHEITGYSPTDARDAYLLRMALTLGALRS
ncbi:PucR family transcriptional regulator [Parenemella sanctibonifatiensis]|uniref:PucR family transcriptional regulator n=1 Tax=Parenemella sanctibonifatiensis TaxID=2016505 RepID=A0A255EMJ7_9ACTN|nr:PucR family transcriptional regulator [Parenemella sanctibonifatiensis]OYN90835.1 PucR family transcriptional regulator [Parenemella sanctibonifatiensis]